MTLFSRSGTWLTAIALAVASGCSTSGKERDAAAADSAAALTDAAEPAADEAAPSEADTPTLPSDDGAASIDPPPCEAFCSSVTPGYPTNEAWGGTGDVTTYSTAPSSGGACGYGATSVRFYAAISVNLQPGDAKGAWQNGAICGRCAEVLAQTSEGPRTAVVRIMDKCSDVFCGIDLGGDATAAVMADAPGRYSGRWKWVPCAGHPETFDGPTSLYVKDGSSMWWSRVQIRNPPTGITGIGWRRAGSTDAYQDLVFSEDNLENFYTVPTTVLQSSSTIELVVRYDDGTSATLQSSSDDLGKADASYPLP